MRLAASWTRGCDVDRTYGGGTIIGLCDALRTRIGEATATLRLETENLEVPPRAPVIVNGFLPPKRSTQEPENPFIIVRPKDGRIPDDGYNLAKVRIIVGTFSEEYDAHEYCIIVFERIMRALREQPTLDRRYTLEYPLTWDLFDEQPYPFWQLVGTTEWIVPTPVMLPDEGVL